jgi:hypothetical protein
MRLVAYAGFLHGKKRGMAFRGACQESTGSTPGLYEAEWEAD